MPSIEILYATIISSTLPKSNNICYLKITDKISDIIITNNYVKIKSESLQGL